MELLRLLKLVGLVLELCYCLIVTMIIQFLAQNYRMLTYGVISDADGTVDAGELSSVSSANLTNVQVTGEQITSGNTTLATSLRKASITTETGDFDM